MNKNRRNLGKYKPSIFDTREAIEEEISILRKGLPVRYCIQGHVSSNSYFLFNKLTFIIFTGLVVFIYNFYSRVTILIIEDL